MSSVAFRADVLRYNIDLFLVLPLFRISLEFTFWMYLRKGRMQAMCRARYAGRDTEHSRHSPQSLRRSPTWKLSEPPLRLAFYRGFIT